MQSIDALPVTENQNAILSNEAQYDKIQIATDNTCYLRRALEHLENEQRAAKNIHRKTYLLYEVHQWYLLLLKSELTESEFHQLLHQAQPVMQSIIDCGYEMAQFLYPNYPFKTIDTVYEDKPIKVFLNLKNDNFQEELENYAKNGIFHRRQLTSETLNTLKPNVTYCYVLTLNGEIFFSELQDFDWIEEGNTKVLITPNHPILARGEPVVAAGELCILNNDKHLIYFVSSTSGHYCADFTTVSHVVKKLVEFGISEDQIVASHFLIPSVAWKFVFKEAKKYKALNFVQ